MFFNTFLEKLSLWDSGYMDVEQRRAVNFNLSGLEGNIVDIFQLCMSTAGIFHALYL